MEIRHPGVQLVTPVWRGSAFGGVAAPQRTAWVMWSLRSKGEIPARHLPQITHTSPEEIQPGPSILDARGQSIRSVIHFNRLMDSLPCLNKLQ